MELKNGLSALRLSKSISKRAVILHSPGNDSNEMVQKKKICPKAKHCDPFLEK